MQLLTPTGKLQATNKQPLALKKNFYSPCWLFLSQQSAVVFVFRQYSFF